MSRLKSPISRTFILWVAVVLCLYIEFIVYLISWGRYSYFLVRAALVAICGSVCVLFEWFLTCCGGLFRVLLSYKRDWCDQSIQAFHARLFIKRRTILLLVEIVAGAAKSALSIRCAWPERMVGLPRLCASFQTPIHTFSAEDLVLQDLAGGVPPMHKHVMETPYHSDVRAA